MLIIIEQDKRRDIFSFQVSVDKKPAYTFKRSAPVVGNLPYVNIFSKMEITDQDGQVPFYASWRYQKEIETTDMPYRDIITVGRDMGAFQ